MIDAEKIRRSMRITHTLLDNEIQNNINTALRDMRRVGVDITKEDALVDKACELYVKSQFDYQKKGDQFRKNYEELRDAMSLSKEYREERG